MNVLFSPKNNFYLYTLLQVSQAMRLLNTLRVSLPVNSYPDVCLFFIQCNLISTNY